jgi:hypothetical protein
MGKETQIVECFACPNCGQVNRIEWDPGETERTIPCIGEYAEKRIPQQMMDEKGEQITLELVVNEGVSFKCVRGSGKEFEERTLDHSLGLDASWAVTKKAVADPGIDQVLHGMVSDG